MIGLVDCLRGLLRTRNELHAANLGSRHADKTCWDASQTPRQHLDPVRLRGNDLLIYSIRDLPNALLD